MDNISSPNSGHRKLGREKEGPNDYKKGKLTLRETETWKQIDISGVWEQIRDSHLCRP